MSTRFLIQMHALSEVADVVRSTFEELDSCRLISWTRSGSFDFIIVEATEELVTEVTRGIRDTLVTRMDQPPPAPGDHVQLITDRGKVWGTVTRLLTRERLLVETRDHEEHQRGYALVKRGTRV